MSKRLIQDLHAGISRRDWWAVETAAIRLRDEVEKTVDILAGTSAGSLPNDYPLSQLATEGKASPRTHLGGCKAKRWLVEWTLPSGSIRWQVFEHEHQARIFQSGQSANPRVTALYDHPAPQPREKEV